MKKTAKTPTRPVANPVAAQAMRDLRAEAFRAKAAADAKKTAALAVAAEADRLRHAHEATAAEAARLHAEHLAHDAEAKRLVEEADAHAAAEHAKKPWLERLFGR